MSFTSSSGWFEQWLLEGGSARASRAPFRVMEIRRSFDLNHLPLARKA